MYMGRIKNKDGSIIQDLTQGSVWRQLIIFSAPMFAASLLQMVYSLVDMVIVGQYEGSLGLSAVSIGSEVTNLMAFLAMGMCSASQVIVAQFVGAGQREKLNKLIGTMFTVILSGAIVITIICLSLCDQIMAWINTPPAALDQAKAYVVTCACGLFFVNGYYLISSILRGMGDAKRPLIFIGVASVTNIVLDLVFVGKMGMGAFGAALATIISQSLCAVWAIIYLYKRRAQFGFDFKLRSFIPDRESLRPVLKLGVPMMIQMAAINFSRLFTAAWINTFGTVIISVTGIGNKLQNVAILFAQSIGTAGGSIIAQSIGAEKYSRVPKVIGISSILTCSFGLLMSLATIFFPDFVFGLFVSEAEVLEMARIYIPVAVLLLMACTARSPIFSLINGSGNSKLNLAVALLDGVVGRIGLCLLLGVALDFGIYGFWYGEALAGCIPIFIGLIYLISGKWKTRKYLIRD